MRTSIVIDDVLLAEALKSTGLKTKKDVVHLALQELVGKYKKCSLLELKGSALLAEGYDYKKLRDNAGILSR